MKKEGGRENEGGREGGRNRRTEESKGMERGEE